MAKIAIAGGHSKACPGAVGYMDEYTENRKISKALIAELKKRGHTVTDCSNELTTQNAELAREVQLANNSNANIFCAIHHNAYQTTTGERGVEVWYWDGDAMGKKVATKMSADLAKLFGLPNRGAKATTGLYVIANTNMTAVLPEVCFVDAKGDVTKHQKTATEKIAAVIADALEAGVGTVKVAEPAPEPTPSPAPTPAPEPEKKEDALTAQDVWAYKNENVEKVDTYQILRDIRDEVTKDDIHKMLLEIRDDVAAIKSVFNIK